MSQEHSPVVEWLKAHRWRKGGGWSETVREFRPKGSGGYRALLIESLTRVAQEEVDEKAASPALVPLATVHDAVLVEPAPELTSTPSPAALHFEF